MPKAMEYWTSVVIALSLNSYNIFTDWFLKMLQLLKPIPL